MELHTYGVTIVPPEKVAEPELNQQLRDAILRVIAERHDLEVPDDWRRHSEPWGGPKSWCWLFEDESFIQAALNPTANCIAKFMCGRNVVLQGTPAIIKTTGTPSRTGTKARNDEGFMRLHTDTHGVPSPLPEWAQLVNISWLLTDYKAQKMDPPYWYPEAIGTAGCRGITKESGGSRTRRCRRSVNRQGRFTRHMARKSWHGSKPRSADGMRITLPFIYGRSYLQTIHDWPTALAQGANAKWLEKYPELSELLGCWHPYPTDRDGPDVPQSKKGDPG
ncbi:MAG: hypothetical protein CM1200mP9_06130 [Gammaproteobacteria bacterium]|nr:MAG: hypothetical protein CM1200mP9_06130 [Gammaproteobacteria bacterium]